MLEFKPDFDEVRANWEKFWQGRNHRPMLSCVIPKPGVRPVAKPPYDIGHDGNFEPAIDQILRWAETHDFLAEAIPFFNVEFAAVHFAALLGADIQFRGEERGNGWIEPFVRDWDEVILKFRPESKWWERTVKFAEALQRRCEGKLLIGAPTLVANLDALSAVRGTQELLLDMVDRPEAVHRALDQVTRAHGEILDALAKALDYPRWGSITRHGMYAPGRVGVPQCDFSCMIGPEMFAEFVMPYLRREVDHYDAVEYHLDGSGAIKHLEAVCSMEKIGVIQWVPGEEHKDWTWLFDKIASLGKGMILGGKPEDAIRIRRKYGCGRIYCELAAASRQEADACVRELDKISDEER